MKSVKILLVCLVAILVISTLAYAEVPKMINYQGKITTPLGALVSDTFSMVFSIYADSSGGTALWSETQTSVKVEYGVFSVLLGSVNPISDSVFSGNARYLGLKVGNDSEMTPRKAIVSVGYAYHSLVADTAHFAMPDADWIIDGDNIYHLNGNVGIGTTSPWSKLHVVTDENRPDIIQGSNPNTGTTAGSGIFFNSDVGYNGGLFQASSNYNDLGGLPNNGAGMLILNTGATSNGIGIRTGLGITPIVFVNGTETMRLVGGNVGIGTTNPLTPLHIAKPGSYYWGNGRGWLTLGDDTYGLSFGIATAGAGAGDARIWTDGGTGKLMISGGASSRDLLTLTNGNVGIGTTSPGYKLDVAGDIRSTGTIYGNFAGTIDNADKLDGFHNGQVSADIWDGHHWGDTYPYSSNSDMVDGVHNGGLTADVWDGHHWGDIYPNASSLNGIGWDRFLRNDQSGTLNGNLTLNGSLSMGSDIYMGEHTLYLGGSGWLKWNYESAETYINTSSGAGVILRFDNINKKLKFTHDGTDAKISTVGGGLFLDPVNEIIKARRINPALNGVYYLGGASDRWGDGYFVNLHYSGTLTHGHLVEGKFPLNNNEIDDGDVIEYDPETGVWVKCVNEKSLGLVSVAAKFTAEERKADPENIEGFEGRPVTLGVYHLKVIGKVKKGQILVSSSAPGCAKAVDATVENLPYRIGRPVELKDTEGIGMIRAYFNIK